MRALRYLAQSDLRVCAVWRSKNPFSARMRTKVLKNEDLQCGSPFAQGHYASRITDPSMRFTMSLTQEEIAGMTGTSRETVSRVLQQFQREKFISIKGSSLTVLQPQALQQLAA